MQDYDHALFQNIPPLVTSIIIQYYCINGYFEIAGNGVTLSKDGSTITINHDSWDNSTYSRSISSSLQKISKWTLEIHDADNYDTDGSMLMIGISTSTHIDEYFHAGPKGARYGYAGWNGMKLNSENNWDIQLFTMVKHIEKGILSQLNSIQSKEMLHFTKMVKVKELHMKI